LTVHVRNLAQFYRQVEAYQVAREAAVVNLEQQVAVYGRNLIPFINVLQAITDWGNAVNAEARSLLQYNTELANLARQTGTILEMHGVRFYEERFGSLGPLRSVRCYPSAVGPGSNAERYPASEAAAEEMFTRDQPDLSRSRRFELPPPEAPLPAPPSPEVLPNP
jgi:hypothetical protein